MESGTVRGSVQASGAISLDLNGLVRSSEHKLRLFIGKRVCNQADVDDLMQMTYLEAWRNQHKFLGASKPETWLFGIAANLVSNHFKRLYRRPRHMLLEDSLLDSLEQGLDPSDLNECLCLLERALEAVESLPNDMQAVLKLLVDSDLSYQNAAHCLGIPVGTVRSRLARARVQLRGSLCRAEVVV
ncbi:RNA polymerase sigma factor [Pseudomonas fontis]|uniref:RNA polymerase sigma factor n=1 Tax=Pseudomonas fontis TaxID=2942633 RepID=A0ABT5NT36_9PSED|nr:RNA polymerase sigma factor [Pseudomonas fontis]MDD0975122.1 RNA polymerase sigma factor [Pseudomonas fontis]MDD0991336.1 RNA polymerase sigma factor [Pseudomonas fontis]